MDVIRFQPGETLTEILETPATSEQVKLRGLTFHNKGHRCSHDGCVPGLGGGTGHMLGGASLWVDQNTVIQPMSRWMTWARWWLGPAEKIVGSYIERQTLLGRKAHGTSCALCVCVLI